MDKHNTIFNFNNTYTDLNNKMYSQVELMNDIVPEVVVLNEALAEELGLDITKLKSEAGVQLLAGGKNTLQSTAYSQAYCGHQFGHFTMLGDGRATILGEHVTKDKKKVDVQLKGSGKTPYSRGGDGKATLSSMLREYLISEALHFMNIKTTRSLAVVKTGESIRRMGIENGAVLTRIAQSHIRFGTFEYAKVYGNPKVLKELADYTIHRHYTHLVNQSDKYTKFLEEVAERQAKLIASWQGIGFIHGVMNTDNMLVSGESIDFGPCAFMDGYNQNTVFSSIDQQGRYAYGNQPYIGAWNLARFAETLLPLLDDDSEIAVIKANKVVSSFEPRYKEAWKNVMGYKIGIEKTNSEDAALVTELLLIMESNNADYTNTFRLLSINRHKELAFADLDSFRSWYKKWQTRLVDLNISIKDAHVLMQQHNPVLIPRNELLQEALENTKKDSFELYFGLLKLYKDPFNYLIEHSERVLEPLHSDSHFATYCGT